ncbi:MAG: response regulator [Pseudobdellovibrionaceae bacterium]
MPRILVVDDNPTNLKLAADLLESEGYEVDRARDAEEAIEILQGELPHLVLMDLALPGMDGLTLTRKLKSESRTKDLLIFAVTASAMKGDEEKVMAAGCDGYISKPIDTEALLTRVNEALRKI